MEGVFGDGRKAFVRLSPARGWWNSVGSLASVHLRVMGRRAPAAPQNLTQPGFDGYRLGARRWNRHKVAIDCCTIYFK